MCCVPWPACVKHSPPGSTWSLASRDTDLVAVLDEVYDMRLRAGPDSDVARIETLSWDDPIALRRFGRLRPTAPRRTWNTNLDRSVFEAARDRNDYA